MSTTETVIRPALASVETGLAVVQFGTFATETVAFEEWDRLSKIFQLFWMVGQNMLNVLKEMVTRYTV